MGGLLGKFAAFHWLESPQLRHCLRPSAHALILHRLLHYFTSVDQFMALLFSGKTSSAIGARIMCARRHLNFRPLGRSATVDI